MKMQNKMGETMCKNSFKTFSNLIVEHDFTKYGQSFAIIIQQVVSLPNIVTGTPL